MDTTKNIIKTMALAIALLAGCTNGSPTPCPQDPQVGWDYDNGSWFDENGEFVGTAPTEDSIITCG